MSKSSTRPKSTAYGGARVHTMLLALVVVAVAGCEERPAPEEVIPSNVAVEPGADFAVALDSGRVAARRAVQYMYLPGVSIAVGYRGRIIWAEGFGWADLSEKTEVTHETLYPAGSISKSMTSVAAGVLHDRGALDLDAPVQTYLTDFPEKEKGTVTTRQLLGHISGMQNYGIYQALRQEHCTDVLEGLPLMQDDTLRRAPGERYYYSNYGFRMVGSIVRVAADEPYLDFMEREVFRPMGMHATVPDTALQVQDGLATPYNQRDFTMLRRSQPVDMSCTIAEGGYLSTPSDLVRLGFGMLDHTVLEEETRDMMWTSLNLNSGSQTGYGLGWFVRGMRLGDDEGSTPMVGHGGSTLGGNASLLIDRENELVVATMANARGWRVNMQRLAGFIYTYFRPQQEGEDG